MNPPPFYLEDDIRFMQQWESQVYRKGEPDHVAAKNRIMNAIGSKTQYWSNRLIEELPALDTFNWRMWSQKGWEQTDNGNVQVARFKHYSWARIYRKGDRDRDLFFTVGVESRGLELVYKLDYYFENDSHLSVEQKNILERSIPDNLRWNSIPISKFSKYNWEILISESKNFILNNLSTYDNLMRMIWGNEAPSEVFKNQLIKRDRPQEGFAELPKLNPSFAPQIIDFEKEAKENKELGATGEKLVIEYERAWLVQAGRSDLAQRVRSCEVGEGYDIESFHLPEAPKFIEVKNTRGNETTPFFLSINEKLYAEKHADRFCIYRLYNYNDESNTADFFIIDSIENQTLLQPTEFKVYLKIN